MKHTPSIGAVTLALAGLVAPAYAWSQEFAEEAGPSPPDLVAEAQPQETPPPPPEARPQAPAQRAVPSGQWVNTWQYGWVWMPYGTAYTSMPVDGDPYMYVYGPAFGWTWVVAPWVWGFGPWPFFGPLGFSHFCWFGRGPFLRPAWHGRPWPSWSPRPFRPMGSQVVRGGFQGGFRPAPPMRPNGTSGGLRPGRR